MPTMFPEILKQLHQIDIDYADGEGIDFEPYDAFLSSDETSEWIKAWTANPQLDGKKYLVFGQDGSGGYAAIWCTRQTTNLLQHPIVFFSSEGSCAVIAQSFYDYIWLFAKGMGPLEALDYPDLVRPESEAFRAFAKEHAPDHERSSKEIIQNAQAEFPSPLPLDAA